MTTIRLATRDDVPAIVAISNWAALHTLANFATEPEPDLDWADRAVRVTVETTLIAALESAGAPGGLGLDIAASLGGLVDFRSDVQGGEAVEVLYREAVLPDGESAGRSELRYARIEIDGRTFEIASQGEGGVPVQVFEDGEAIRMDPAEWGNDGAHWYQGAVPCARTGHRGYAVRVLPGHPELMTPFLPGLIRWSSDAVGQGSPQTVTV